MNKYAALGILLDAAEGKHVAVVAVSHRAAVEGMRDFEIPQGDGWRASRTNGNREITSPAGGRITFHSVRSNTRGMQFDTVFLDTDVDRLLDLADIRDLQYTLRPGGQIIRA